MNVNNLIVLLKIAGTRAVGILIAILRLKIVSLLLGPSGIAVLSALNLLVLNGKAIAGLGVQQSATRKIAQAVDDPDAQDRLVHLVLSAHLMQVLPLIVVLVAGSTYVSVWIFGTSDRSWLVAALAFALLAEMLAMVAGAAFLGTRRTVELAWITLAATAMATVAGALTIMAFGEGGLLGFVIAQPAFLGLIAWLRWKRPLRITRRILGVDWALYRETLVNGVQLMLSSLLMPLGLLVALAIMTNARGVEVAGLYAAAVAIASQYVGMFISAIGADFYPELSAHMTAGKNPALAEAAITRQTRLSLALFSAPLMLFIFLSEAVLVLLFSRAFQDASDLLQGLVLASTIRLAFTPIGISVVAGGHHKAFLWRNLFSIAVFIAMAWMVFGEGPLALAALPFIFYYALNGALSVGLARARNRIGLDAGTWLRIAFVVASATAMVLLGTGQSVVQGWLSAGILTAVTVWSAVELFQVRRNENRWTT